MEDETQPITAEEAEQAYMDNQQDYGDFVGEQQENQQFGSYPQENPRDSIFTLFWRILGLKDSTKVANLDKRELGMLDLSVRNSLYLSKLGTMLHNKSYTTFFFGKSEIVNSTSMAKKGWYPELMVSQKKFTQRQVQPMALQKSKKGFLGLGGGKTEQPQQQLG